MSSVEKVSESCERRYSSASSSAMSCWRYIASWPSRISTGLLEASFAGPVGDRGVELVGRHDLVDEPVLDRLLGA